MNDPAAPRTPKGWPLVAISLLIVLLAGFLILKWRKKEDAPILVKEAPPAVGPVDAPPGPVKSPPPPDKREIAPGPAANTGDFEQHLKNLQKALEAKSWDGAAAAFEAARKLRADAAELKGVEALIAEGRRKEETERG